MIEIIKGLLIIVGTGVILHYYAYAIAWGIRNSNATKIGKFQEILTKKDQEHKAELEMKEKEMVRKIQLIADTTPPGFLLNAIVSKFG